MMFCVPEPTSSKGVPVNNIVQRAMTDKTNSPVSPNAGEGPVRSTPQIAFIKINTVLV